MTAAKTDRNQPRPGIETARPETRQHPGPETNRATTDSAAEAHRTTPAHNNLTLPRTPLVGRDHEVAAVQRLLLQEQVGLLTLTGPGGIGKTRLALQAAANALDHFVDGVYFVSLAPISDPDLVASALAQTLGVREAAGRPLQESLQESLRDKQLLLVLWQLAYPICALHQPVSYRYIAHHVESGGNHPMLAWAMPFWFGKILEAV